jgi:hypothetical protein
MNTKRITYAMAVLLGCTPIHATRTLETLSAGACIAGDAATVAGQSWGAIVSAVACALERHAARRAERMGTTELASEADIAAAELEQALDACDDEPTPEQQARVIDALLECERLEGQP